MAASLMPSIVTHTAQVPFYDYFAHSFGHQLVRSSVIIRLLHSCLRTSHAIRMLFYGYFMYAFDITLTTAVSFYGCYSTAA
jgi:hypothetical protein